MPHMLVMAALEFSHPMRFRILMKPGNAPLHRVTGKLVLTSASTPHPR